MTFRTLGWAALGLFVAATIPFWVQVLCGSKARTDLPSHSWILGSFTVFGLSSVLVSVAFFGGWLQHLTRAWPAGFRWTLTLLACALLLVIEIYCWLMLCFVLNFSGG